MGLDIREYGNHGMGFLALNVVFVVSEFKFLNHDKKSFRLIKRNPFRSVDLYDF